MNIVKIQRGPIAYLYGLPEHITLTKGQRVKVETQSGNADFVCAEDSKFIDDKTLEYLAAVANYRLPLKPVLGIWGYQEFAKPEVKAVPHAFLYPSYNTYQEFAKPEVKAEPEANEPVRLYCVKDWSPGFTLTKGKIYETDPTGRFHYDDGNTSAPFNEAFKMSSPKMSSCLVPLVKRPAKVGEWVLVTDRGDSRYEINKIYKVIATCDDPMPGCVFFGRDYKGNIKCDGYEVLDGYNGEYHA